MCATLRSLSQWDVVTRCTTAPTPVDPVNPTPTKQEAIRAFEVRSISAPIEITFCVDSSAKSAISDLEDPKRIWELLEQRPGARKEGLQGILRAKLQPMEWDEKREIMAHRDAVVALWSKLMGAGHSIPNQSFYEHFLDSLPRSMDMFIGPYNDATADVDALCTSLQDMGCKSSQQIFRTEKHRVVLWCSPVSSLHR